MEIASLVMTVLNPLIQAVVMLVTRCRRRSRVRRPSLESDLSSPLRRTARPMSTRTPGPSSLMPLDDALSSSTRSQVLIWLGTLTVLGCLFASAFFFVVRLPAT